MSLYVAIDADPTSNHMGNNMQNESSNDLSFEISDEGHRNKTSTEVGRCMQASI